MLQTLKNALASFEFGGAGGGSDFDPKGRSENEVNSCLLFCFCVSHCNAVLYFLHNVQHYTRY